MITLKTLDVQGLEPAIHGMRNPKNSWDKSDSDWVMQYDEAHAVDRVLYMVGEKDHELMMKLANAGPVHGKFRRMIAVWVDITAPLYWWKEFDTYKVGTVANSCSTMHKIHAKEFERTDFSEEHLIVDDAKTELLSWGQETHIMVSPDNLLNIIIGCLNNYRKMYLETKDKEWWWQMIQLLPSSYNQTRTLMLNYEVLANICEYRRGHKLDEWADFIKWAKTLPYSELFLGGDGNA